MWGVPGILVVEGDRECLVRRGRPRRLDEGDVLGLDQHVGRRRRSAPGRTEPERGLIRGARPDAGARRPPATRGPAVGLVASRTPSPAGRSRRGRGPPSAVSVADGVRGAGPFSRCPVRSASTVRTYSLRASTSQPTSVAIERRSRRRPAASRRRRGRPSTAMTPIAPMIGRNDGPGMWTPGGGSPTTTGTRRDGRSSRHRGRRCAGPRPASRATSGSGRSRRARGSRRRRRGRASAGTRRPTAKTGENDGPGMWMPAGVRAGIRLAPRRDARRAPEAAERPDQDEDDRGSRCRPGSARSACPSRA